MPARDLYHDVVRQALLKDGWTITHDPLHLRWAGRDLFVDLGAERLLAAERAGAQIAVEIKSFLSESPLTDLHGAVGQFVVYQDILEEIEPGRVLYLALPLASYRLLFEAGQIGAVLLEKGHVRLIVFDPAQTEVVQWLP